MATNMDIDTRARIDDIRSIIAWSGLESDVEIVPSIQAWCAQREVPEESPFRTGRIVRNAATGRYVILLPERITSDMVSSVVTAMELRGFEREVAVLSDPNTFARHLVLHEIAHGLDHTRTEQECDEWAFQQLRQLPSNRAAHPDAREASHLLSPSQSRAGGRER